MIIFFQSQIYIVFGTERTKAEVYGSFCYSIDSLNISNCKMNLIANSEKTTVLLETEFLPTIQK